MSFFNRIKDFFINNASSNKAELISSVAEERTNLETDNPRFQEYELSAIPNRFDLPTSNTLEVPNWFANEDLLRDEGVVFGLSESKSEEKIAVIRTFFAHQTADLEKEVSIYNEKIGELNLFIGQKETQIEDLTQKSQKLEDQKPAQHSILRTLVGLLLSLGMCVGNYYLIAESIQNYFPQNHLLISLGVFLAGMFNLFGRTSFLHEKESKISYRQILEEIGMPLAASIFVFVQIIDSQSFMRSFALFFFVFFLFLFAGKLLLSNLTLIKDDFENWYGNIKLKADKINKSKDWEADILALNSEIDELRVQKWQIISDLKAPETELMKLNGKREMLIKLFESEFNLARSFREKLTKKQIKEIFE